MADRDRELYSQILWIKSAVAELLDRMADIASNDVLQDFSTNTSELLQSISDKLSDPTENLTGATLKIGIEDVSALNAVPTEVMGQVEIADPGQSVVYVHRAISVTTSSQEVLSPRTDRKYGLLQNISDTDINIYFGGPAAASTGIILKASTGSFEYGVRFGNLDVRGIYAIHGGTGSKTLLITEG